MRDWQFFLAIMSTLLIQGFLIGETEIIFGPDEQPVTRLVELIGKAKERVYVATYMLSDKKIVDVLIKAYKKQIDVRVVIDPFSFDKFGKGRYLIQNEVPTYIYKTVGELFERRLHMKLVLIDQKVWCGSANLSLAGNSKNQEAVIITTDKGIVQKVEEQFKLLLKSCVSYTQYQQNLFNYPSDVQEVDQESQSFYEQESINDSSIVESIEAGQE